MIHGGSHRARDAPRRRRAPRQAGLVRRRPPPRNPTPPDECDRLSKRNFYRFLKKYADREDLLLSNGES